jgi:hypothetical protein
MKIKKYLIILLFFNIFFLSQQLRAQKPIPIKLNISWCDVNAGKIKTAEIAKLLDKKCIEINADGKGKGQYKIASFDFTFVPKGTGRQVSSNKVEGSRLPGIDIEIIRAALPGDRLLISGLTFLKDGKVYFQDGGPTFIVE